MKKINKDFILSFIIFYLIINIFFPYISRFIKYNVGDLAKENIIAPFDFPVLKNEDELKKEMNITSLSVPPILKMVEINLDLIGLKKNVPQNVKKIIIDARNKGIIFDKKSLPQSFGDLFEIVRNEKRYIVKKDDFFSYNEVKKIILEELTKKYDLKTSDEILKELEPFIQPNLLLDISETEKIRELARKTVSKEKSYVKKGELIIKKNDIITEEIFDVISSLILAQKKFRKHYFLKNFLKSQPVIIALILIFLFIIKELWEDFFIKRKNILVTGLVSFTLLLSYRIFHELGFVIILPLSFGAMLLSLEGGTLIGIFYTIFLSSIFIIFYPYENLNILPLIFSSIIGSIYIRNVRERKDIMKLIIYIFIFLTITSLSIDIIQSKRILIILSNIIFTFLNTGISIGLLFLLLLVFERLFGISTNFSFVELASLNQPLLAELVLKAPGTYHHSIMVGNLSEAAAEAIKANPILAKVGGYYHDIGKLERPEYFIENINPQINPHNELPPKLSVAILKSHITDGVILGKIHHLPNEVINIITEHHGSTLIRPFFEKAKEIYDNIDEKDYSYDGPTPSSKESSIVMLADSVEAASKSADFESEEDIKKLVDRIVEIKIEEKQLDNGELSLKDIKIIKEVFTKRLLAAYHSRINYPKISLK